MFLFYQVNMDYQDLLEQQKSDAKNAVEEYVYNMRDKISSSLQVFITEEDRTKFLEQLDATEEWLYDEGEDQPKKVYVERLKVQQHIPFSLGGVLSPSPSLSPPPFISFPSSLFHLMLLSLPFFLPPFLSSSLSLFLPPSSLPPPSLLLPSSLPPPSLPHPFTIPRTYKS